MMLISMLSFSNKKYADQVLNQAYRSLPDYLPMESRGYRGNGGIRME